MENSPEYLYSHRGSRLQHWQRDRTRCFPDLCLYAWACSSHGEHHHYVRKQDCFRHRPQSERPPAGLCPLALRLLARWRTLPEEG